jgi:NitT/TauT family transport system ATP-binding protein
VIAVDHLRHTFRRPNGACLPVLDGVSFAVPDGAFVSLLGPTGCGKTTLLRIVDGLVRPTEGRVLVDGRPVLGPGADRAVVFQEVNLLPWRTARANVELGLELQGVAAAERRRAGQAALDLVGLGAFADLYPHELSGGMKQRVGLARALCAGPGYLLMDEPFGALDMQTREQMQRELAALMESERKTVLFVTHSVDEALLLSDRVVVLGARPARVLRQVEVPLPRPRARAWRELRADRLFVELRETIWEMVGHQAPEPLPVGVGR